MDLIRKNNDTYKTYKNRVIAHFIEENDKYHFKYEIPSDEIIKKRFYQQQFSEDEEEDKEDQSSEDEEPINGNIENDEEKYYIKKFNKLNKLYERWGDYPCYFHNENGSIFYYCVICKYRNIDFHEVEEHINSCHKCYHKKKEINLMMLHYLENNRKNMTTELYEIIEGIEDYTDIDSVDHVYIKLKNNENKPFKLY